VTPTAPEPTAARRTLTGLALAVILLAAVVLQLTVVNRLPLPAAYPDLVLLAVTAIAVCTGTLPGTLAGFAGGLALDVAPPASHYAGEYALVFCLAGYGAARAVRAIYDLTGERDPVTRFTVMAVAAAAGEAGKAALGMLLSEPDVTGPAIKQVLPAAILYDLLLAPLVFLLVAGLTRGADAERAPAPEFSYAQRLASVFRAASYGAAPLSFAPRKRLSGTGADYSAPVRPRRVPRLRLDGTGDDHRSPSLPRSVPQLRLSRGGAGSIGRTGSAASPGAALRPAGAGSPSLNFAADRPARNLRRTARSPGKNWLRSGVRPPRSASRVTPRPAKTSAVPRHSAFRGSAFRGSAFRGSAFRGSAFRGSAFKNGASALRIPAYRAGAVPRIPARGWLRAGGHGSAQGAAGVAGSAPRSGAEVLAARSAPSGLSALSGAVTPLARRSPRSGWLRAGSPSWASHTGPRLSPHRGWLGGTSRSRTVIGSTPGGAGGPRRGNWYTAGPSRDWVRHSRHPWRKRRQRLLRMVGVGR